MPLQHIWEDRGRVHIVLLDPGEITTEGGEHRMMLWPEEGAELIHDLQRGHGQEDRGKLDHLLRRRRTPVIAGRLEVQHNDVFYRSRNIRHGREPFCFSLGVVIAGSQRMWQLSSVSTVFLGSKS